MKRGQSDEPAKNVDEYLAAIPEESRAVFEKLRETIRAAAPKATEKISYRMPTFYYLGPLVAISVSTNHCGFHLMSPAVMRAHKDEIKGYETTTATVRFPFDKPLPVALIKKIVKARIKENEARAEKEK
jgi:uncharacterized protein YdhG (YjbR/CyaY superfamily)